MTSDGNPLEFSNWGELYQSHGVLALGQDIIGAVPGGGTHAQTGTSFAAAIVSGICGLLLSLQFKLHGQANAWLVRDAILRSARGCDFQQASDCRRLLTGRLHVPGAISLILQGVNDMTEMPSIQNIISQQAADAAIGPSTEAIAGSESTTNDDPRWRDRLPSLEVAAGRGVHSSASAFREEGAVAPVVRPCSVDDSSCGDAGISAAGLSPVGGFLSSSLPNLTAAGISPSDCGCKGGSTQLVYALGRLGYDFGSEARRDWFRSQMRYAGPGGRDLDPYVPSDLEAFFQGSPATEDQVARVGHPEAAEAVIWTLNFDATAIYAIHPVGPFARDVYQLLRQFLKEQQPIGVEGGQGAERLAVPGLIAGKVRLFSGQVVPVIQPDPRGLLNWTTGALTETVIEALSGIAGVNPRAEIANFLDRVYYEFRNLGITSQERALNYAGTVARLFGDSIQSELSQGYQLDTIVVQRSAVCRPESDCWDVRLTFYNPRKQLEEARHMHMIPIDVSDVIPVALADRRIFFVR